MELTVFEKRVQLKRNLIAKHEKELAAILIECTHENIERKSRYISSTYYDPSYSIYYNKCRCCGKESDRRYD